MELEQKLSDLKKLMLEMGGFVEKALVFVQDGLNKRDIGLLNQVHEVEKSINQLQIEVDNLCLTIIAQQGPVARDLRLVLSIIKMNTDLERMGDQCVNMAYIGREFIERKQLTGADPAGISLGDVQKMVESAKSMVKLALDSFVQMDSKVAEKVLCMDDEVDSLRTVVFQKSVKQIKTDTALTESCLDLIFLARNLERLGDHATNIAEDVIFANTGRDVRHNVKTP
jgi:phosphate transport system protein